MTRQVPETMRRTPWAPERDWMLSVVSAPGDEPDTAPRRLRDPSIPIGREPRGPSSVVLSDPAVSARGVRLVRADGGAYNLCNEGARNPVRVNGALVRDVVRLSSNDVIRVGDTLMVIECSDAARTLHARSTPMSMLDALYMTRSTARAVLFTEAHYFDPARSCVAVDASGHVEIGAFVHWLSDQWHVRVDVVDAEDPTAVEAVRSAGDDAAVFVANMDLAEPAVTLALIDAIYERLQGSSDARIGFSFTECRVGTRLVGLAQDSDARFRIPRLSDRRNDILTAVRNLARREEGAADVRIPVEVGERLLCYDWPGGVGELRAVSRELGRRFARDRELTLVSLPVDVRVTEIETGSMSSGQTFSAETFQEAFVEYGGNINKVAAHFGKHRSHIYRLAKSVDVEIADLRKQLADDDG